MYSTTARAYDDSFVQTTVQFGTEMAKLRKYRDELGSQLRGLSLTKMDFTLSGKSTKEIQVQIDDLARTKHYIGQQIDQLMSVQTSHLKTCIHNG